MKNKWLVLIPSMVGVVILLSFFIFFFTQKKNIDAPNIAITEDIVVWSDIDNALSYDVYINDEFEANTKESRYKITITDNGKYDIYVIAVAGKKHKNSKKSNIVEYIVADLEKPYVRLSDREIIWDRIENAIKYEIFVDGEHLDYTTDNKYSLDLDPLEHSISVKAIGNNKNIKDSEESTPIKYKQLLPPTLSRNGDYITWPQIDNASSYEVYVDGTRSIIEYPQIEVPVMRGLHEFQVAYKGKNGYSSSNLSPKFFIEIYEKLDSVVNIKNDGDRIIWNKVNNAIGYELEINDGTNKTYEIVNTNYFEYTLLAYGKYDIRVKALADSTKYYENSDISYTFELKYLPRLETPVASITGDTISWNLISGAIGYSIYHKDECLVQGIDTLSYDLSFLTKADLYELTIVANGDLVNSSDSLKSNVCTYLITDRLSAPTFKIENTLVTFNAVENATGYYVYVDGNYNGKTTTDKYVLDNLSEGSYIITAVSYSDNSEVFKDSVASYGTRFIVEGIEKAISNGIVSFDQNGFILSNNSEGITVGIDNTPEVLDGGFEYLNVTYSYGYLIDNTTTISITTLVKTAIRVIYKGGGNGGIYLREKTTNLEYEIVGVTSVGFDITTTLNNLPLGEYEVFTKNGESTYILAIIIDAKEEKIEYVYQSYNKDDYIRIINGFDMNNYDEACVAAISSERDSKIAAIQRLYDIPGIESLVREFENFTARVATKELKQESEEYLRETMGHQGNTLDEIATACNELKSAITLEQVDEVLNKYLNNQQ